MTNETIQVSERAREYRKTATIRAVQWWKMGDHPAVLIPGSSGVAYIETLEGGHIVTPGDWIATGVKGEHWPIKPDVFAASYVPVERDLLAGQSVGDCVLVPKEPTAAMIEAAKTVDGWPEHKPMAHARWTAMLAAAPSPKAADRVRLAELIYHAEGFTELIKKGNLSDPAEWVEDRLAGEHNGDCTQQPYSCMRCHAEDYMAIANWVADRWPDTAPAPKVVDRDATPLVFYDSSDPARRVASLADALKKGEGRASIVGWQRLIADLNAALSPPSPDRDERTSIEREVERLREALNAWTGTRFFVDYDEEGEARHLPEAEALDLAVSEGGDVQMAVQATFRALNQGATDVG